MAAPLLMYAGLDPLKTCVLEASSDHPNASGFARQTHARSTIDGPRRSSSIQVSPMQAPELWQNILQQLRHLRARAVKN